MQCEQFEVQWQQILDQSGDPKNSPELVAHALLCSNCHDLLEGSDRLFNQLSYLPTPRQVQPVLAERIVWSSSGMWRTTRWANWMLASAALLVVGWGLWGSALVSNETGSFALAPELLLPGNSQGLHFAELPKARRVRIDPFTPSPIGIAIQAQATPYFVSIDDFSVPNLRSISWQTQWFGIKRSPEVMFRNGFAPLTNSIEAAWELIKNSLYPLHFDDRNDDPPSAWQGDGDSIPMRLIV